MFELSGWLIRSSHALRLVTFSFYSSARVFTQLRTCWWCAQVWRASGRQASRPTVTLLIHPFLSWLFLFSPLDTRRSHLFIFIYIVLFLFIFFLLLHPLKYFGSHFVASDSPPTLFFFGLNRERCALWIFICVQLRSCAIGRPLADRSYLVVYESYEICLRPLVNATNWQFIKLRPSYTDLHARDRR